MNSFLYFVFSVFSLTPLYIIGDYNHHTVICTSVAKVKINVT